MNVRYIIGLALTFVLIIVLWQIPPLNLGGFIFNIGHVILNLLVFICVMNFLRPWVDSRIERFSDLFRSKQKKRKGLHDY